MTAHKEVLELESSLQEMAQELARIKAAAEQIRMAGTLAGNITATAERLVTLSDTAAKISDALLTRLEHLANRLDSENITRVLGQALRNEAGEIVKTQQQSQIQLSTEVRDARALIVSEVQQSVRQLDLDNRIGKVTQTVSDSSGLIVANLRESQSQNTQSFGDLRGVATESSARIEERITTASATTEELLKRTFKFLGFAAVLTLGCLGTIIYLLARK